MGIKLTKHDIGAEIISILTKGMYFDPRDALREYVQNGIDANAQNIEIKIRGNSIVVEDDGCCLNSKHSMVYWMLTGKSWKKFVVFPNIVPCFSIF